MKDKRYTYGADYRGWKTDISFRRQVVWFNEADEAQPCFCAIDFMARKGINVRDENGVAWPDMLTNQLKDIVDMHLDGKLTKEDYAHHAGMEAVIRHNFNYYSDLLTRKRPE